MKILAGSSNPSLAKNLAASLKSEVIPIEISTFANGEKRIWVKGEVQGEDVIMVQSFSHPTDEHIIELLLMADALERMGANHVSAIIPWLGYSLQDKVFRPGEPIAAKVVANLVSHSYIHRVYLLDLHNTSTPGFFSIPTHHLSAQNLFVEYARQHFDTKNVVVASPDFGGSKRAKSFAEDLNVPLANISKYRDLTSGTITHMGLHGEVEGKEVILLDDVILSGGTAINAAQLIKESGAKSVHFFSTHGVFVEGSLPKLTKSALDSIVISNSIDQQNLPKKIIVLDCSPVFVPTFSGRKTHRKEAWRSAN
jgi:ribose-phosphate pyrophosphokinase